MYQLHERLSKCDLSLADCAHLQAGRNPSLYSITPGDTLDKQLEKRLLSAIGSLVQHGLVRFVNLS